tara:strand:- start:351 stop:1574 length:1224 start_codon:yes stop_codon:yes gene_type:complete
MKSSFFYILLFSSFFSVAQITISGTIYERNNTLEGAAVYLNNTMLGTTTNSNGTFSIKVKEGQYDLVISCLGYKKIIYPLNTATYKRAIVFVLEEDSNTLDEIIIKKTVYDDEWRYNLSLFKKEFIGITNLSKDCEILNPTVLHFNFEAKNDKLSAIAKAPLKIKHKGLGYQIIYELEEFTIHKNKVIYLGYSRYKKLKGSKRKQRKWQANREKAYQGSSLHFYQSLLKNTSYQDGFIIHQFKRIANPERPSKKEIKKASEIVTLNNTFINFSSKITKPKTQLDSALLILKKIKLPKFRDYLYKSKVPVNDIIRIKNGVSFLDFENNISVVYTRELEEKGYILRNMFRKTRTPLPQTSSVIPLKSPSILDKNGILINPLSVFYEGYWSYEKFADSLPLDYVPLTSMQ